MNLRGKLKQKEGIEVENEKLKLELQEYRQKHLVQEKKKLKYKEQAKDMQVANEKLVREVKSLKEEIGEMMMGKKQSKKVGATKKKN